MAKLNKFNYHLALPPDMPDEMKSGVENTVDQLEQVVLTYDETIFNIQNSKELTAIGKGKELAKLSLNVDKDLKAIEDSASGYEKNINQVLQSLKPPSSPKDDLLTYLKEKEIREFLYTKDQLEVETIYQKSVIDGDIFTSTAIENAPRLNPLVRKTTIDDMQSKKLEKLYPDASDKLKHLRTAQSVTQSAISTARLALEKKGIPKSIEDLKLAAGGGE